MSKQIPDLMELNKSQVTDDDLMMIRDVSENRDKKASIGSIVGRPREGWIAVISDVWTFSAYSFETHVGTVTCNAGALALYSIGMRVKFVQNSTQKYAVIVELSDTTIGLYMIDDGALGS